MFSIETKTSGKTSRLRTVTRAAMLWGVLLALAVDSVGHEWRELAENFPERSDTSVEGGVAERHRARGAVRGLVLSLRRIAMAVVARRFCRRGASLRRLPPLLASAALGAETGGALVAVQSGGAAGAFPCAAQLATLAR